ncbi:unnamed protein product (mitochondrion) [Plasmodiophora brassicae]|uniref:Uncharacterized protein n=1 Tax=Plasmodiophora brassicae TaxID=37360 RepID=A0A3P3Y9Z0_PLABS|nr:unnamed protein product [Plasmodiophora brassicae]
MGHCCCPSTAVFAPGTDVLHGHERSACPDHEHPMGGPSGGTPAQRRDAPCCCDQSIATGRSTLFGCAAPSWTFLEGLLRRIHEEHVAASCPSRSGWRSIMEDLVHFDHVLVSKCTRCNGLSQTERQHGQTVPLFHMSMFGRSSTTVSVNDLLGKLPISEHDMVCSTCSQTTRHTRAEAYTSSLASRWSGTVVIAMHWTYADHSGNALRVDCPVKFLFGETLLQLCGLVISLPSQAAGQRKLVAICLSEESRYAQTKRFFLCAMVRSYTTSPTAMTCALTYRDPGRDRAGADAQCEQQKSTSPKRANVDGSAAKVDSLQRRPDIDRQSAPPPGKRVRAEQGRLSRSSSSEASSPGSSSSDGDPTFCYSSWERFRRRFAWIDDLKLGDPDLDVRRGMCHIDEFRKREPAHDEAGRTYAALKAMLSRSASVE